MNRVICVLTDAVPCDQDFGYRYEVKQVSNAYLLRIVIQLNQPKMEGGHASRKEALLQIHMSGNVEALVVMNLKSPAGRTFGGVVAFWVLRILCPGRCMHT